jgi:two-component system CheB/CheR fusion protein
LTGNLRIVGIGASAGGIEALRGFFQGMPDPDGLAFVVVLHLSPDRTSMLAEVLQQWTSLPVRQATDGIQVAGAEVFVIPPNILMTIEDGRLHLRAPTTIMVRENKPIDVFFTSLAADQGAAAVGVVLSGTGSDGSLGLKAIKEAGGLSLAQGGNGHGPQYRDMPTSAISTGAVDLILPVEAMAERILNLPARPAPEPEEVATHADAPLIGLLPQICQTLRDQVGHDFSDYKRPTFIRRVQRRMQFLGLDAPAYVGRLQADPNEVLLLFQDLLIRVTSFFRDPATYHALETEIIPRLFAGKGRNDALRVWVAGCATGEEAYSIAMLLYEHAEHLSDTPRLQVLATDIDDMAINVARSGRYPALLVKDIPPERLAHCFTSADDTYQVRKEVREICTFSTHSVIRDPPFSRIDLISCRNLLIYLDTELQNRVIPAFHYSLVPNGYLLLGSSEMVSRHHELFMLIDKPNRIFQRHDTPGPSLQVAPLAISGRHVAGLLPQRHDAPTGWSGIAQAAKDRILERHAPAFVVVDASGAILHFSPHTGRYLEPAAGMPTRDLVSMAKRDLRLELRAALHKVLETGQPVERMRVRMDTDGLSHTVALSVEPLQPRDGQRLFIVVFNETADASQLEPGIGPLSHEGTDELERELSDLREQLQSTVEEYDTALEELKSANEELQSTNEELETSKEEIQSVNEELQTTNTQLTMKVEELDRANSDLHNLFESTQIATIFLDRFMVVRSFTPAVAGIYNLIPGDRGRPLADIVSQIDYADLQADTRRVLDTQQPFERRVVRHDGSAHYLMRILPYRAADSRVDGVLVTFTDITSVVQAEQQQRVMVDELNHRVRNMLTVVISIATLTIRQSSTMEEFSKAFVGRVSALASAYTLLSRDNWTRVPLRDVLTEELRPFMSPDKPRFAVEGEPVLLQPRAALAFGMIIHELTTNAVKYGALSVPDGHVELRWTITQQNGTQQNGTQQNGTQQNGTQQNGVQQDGMQQDGMQQDGQQDGARQLVCRWTEHGGPQIEPPQRLGFGFGLIERSTKYELEGEAIADWQPQGLAVTLKMPLDAIGGRGKASSEAV